VSDLLGLGLPSAADGASGLFSKLDRGSAQFEIWVKQNSTSNKIYVGYFIMDSSGLKIYYICH
jgi:hypothetical protein